MWEVIKGLFGSKKFWVAVVGGAIVAGMQFAGVSAEEQTKITAIIATLLGAMGLSDLGKNAPTPPQDTVKK